MCSPAMLAGDEVADDPVAVAEAFLGTPYLWGGRTSIGLDCSGLVQLAVEAAGITRRAMPTCRPPSLARRSIWREGASSAAAISCSGMAMSDHDERRRDLLHANAHHMAVEIEPFADAKERIMQAGYEVIGVRRLPRIRQPLR